MKRTALRITLSCTLALAIGAVAVPVALGETALTKPATAVSATSAVLHGTVNSGSQAGFYEFEYGLAKIYTTATPLQMIGTGGQNQEVSAQVTNLMPNTRYHFRIVFIARGGIYYSYLTVNGPDQTFRTSATGRLGLVSRTLIVKRGRLTAILGCPSQLRCTGTYSVTTRTRLAHSRRFGTVVCTQPGSASFNIPPQQTRKVGAKITRACASLLGRARSHALNGKFSSPPGTGQPGVITPVVLTLG